MPQRRRPSALAAAPDVARRPSREQVRHRLLSAALDVFLDVGYGDARLEDIAKVAGFTTGAVYSNFGSKQELFASLLAHHSVQLNARTLHAMDTAAGSHEAARDALTTQIIDDPRWSQLVAEFALQAARYDDIQAAFAKARRTQCRALADSLRERAALMRYPANLDYDAVALALVVLVNGLTLEHAANPDGATPETIRGILDLALRAPWFAAEPDTCS